MKYGHLSYYILLDTWYVFYCFVCTGGMSTHSHCTLLEKSVTTVTIQPLSRTELSTVINSLHPNLTKVCYSRLLWAGLHLSCSYNRMFQQFGMKLQISWILFLINPRWLTINTILHYMYIFTCVHVWRLCTVKKVIVI